MIQKLLHPIKITEEFNLYIGHLLPIESNRLHHHKISIHPLEEMDLSNYTNLSSHFNYKKINPSCQTPLLIRQENFF